MSGCDHSFVLVTATTTDEPVPYSKCAKCGEVRPRQFLTASFASGGMAYTYHNDGQPVGAGQRVLVDGRGGNGTRTVTVQEIGVAKPKFPTKPILGLAPDVEEAPAADAPPPGKLL